MQIPSTESSWTDVTVPNNTRVLSLVATVNQRIRLRSKVLTMCKMKKYSQEYQFITLIWTIISYCTFRIANNSPSNTGCKAPGWKAWHTNCHVITLSACSVSQNYDIDPDITI